MPNRQHGTRRRADDLLGDTSHEEMFEAAAAAGSDDHQIDTSLFRMVHNRKRWAARCEKNGFGAQVTTILVADQGIEPAARGFFDLALHLWDIAGHRSVRTRHNLE